jgi:protein gp37
VDWLIVGGESGHGARPMHPAWARSLRDQCLAAGLPFFFKQFGAWSQLPEPFRYDPLIGSDNRHYHRALKAFARKHGATRLLSDRPEGWDGAMIRDGCSIRDGEYPIGLVGKKTAGRHLDGVEWNEFPTTAAQEVPHAR